MRISDWSSDVCSSDLKRRQDAEALARLPDGSLLVAFEREHRLRRFPADLGGRAEVFDAPPGLAEADINAGIEAMVTLADGRLLARSEEHTSELQSLMRISYAVFCLKKKKPTTTHLSNTNKTAN